MMEERYVQAGGEVGEDGGEEAEGSVERDWVAELERFQAACTAAAREAEEANAKRKRGGSPQTKKEAKRASVGKWNRIAEQARRWNGKLKKGKRSWQQTTFVNVERIARDRAVLDALEGGGDVKSAVLSVCDRELKRATTVFENVCGRRRAPDRRVSS